MATQSKPDNNRPGRHSGHSVAPSLEMALFTAVESMTGLDSLAPVSHLELAPGGSNLCRSNNFAALILEDGNVGLTYVALDDALAQLRERLADPAFAIRGRTVRELARLYLGGRGWERALGLAAVNAASQAWLGRQQTLQPMPSTVPMLDLEAGDHVGMVGQFGRLLGPIRDAGARLTVIELNPSLVREEDGLVVTLDHRALAACNKIIITGTTLLNGSLDDVLQHTVNASQVNLLGPSASCLGAPLFGRGVTRVGGFHVNDCERFLALWRAGESWQQAGVRYQLCA